jgi:hypothetical protein
MRYKGIAVEQNNRQMRCIHVDHSHLIVPWKLQWGLWGEDHDLWDVNMVQCQKLNKLRSSFFCWECKHFEEMR